MLRVLFIAISLIVGLIWGLAVSAWAGPLEDGVAAYRKRNYEVAMKLLKPLAEEGNPVAQEHVGRMVERGKTVPADFREALDWYMKAADQGDAVAQGQVGRIYRIGFFNGRADFGNALKYYRMAAAKNVAVAQLGLGSMYKAGEGVPENEAEAVTWFRKAADQGDAAAQMNLAAMYRYGKGVPKDLKEAQRLLKLAAAGTDPEYDEDVFVRAKRELDQMASEAGTGRL
ncbi:MAG: tetratricopeptide repeat protein [Enhydrobacter sp.]